MLKNNRNNKDKDGNNNNYNNNDNNPQSIDSQIKRDKALAKLKAQEENPKRKLNDNFKKDNKENIQIFNNKDMNNEIKEFEYNKNVINDNNNPKNNV